MTWKPWNHFPIQLKCQEVSTVGHSCFLKTFHREWVNRCESPIGKRSVVSYSCSYVLLYGWISFFGVTTCIGLKANFETWRLAIFKPFFFCCCLKAGQKGLGLVRIMSCIAISMEAILTCHPARATEWLDCHPKLRELWRNPTGPIVLAQFWKSCIYLKASLYG